MVCFTINHVNKHRAIPVFKDWFDSDCRQKRCQYKRKKNRYNYTKSNQKQIEMRECAASLDSLCKHLKDINDIGNSDDVDNRE